MSQDKKVESDVKMVLDHEEVPGYRPVFFVAITVGILYLAFIFFKTL